MKKIIILLTAAAATLGVYSCKDDNLSNVVEPADQLFLPRNNYPVDTSKNVAIKFEWKTSATEDSSYLSYELLFDTENGDFSDPVYVVKSSNNGYSPEAVVSGAAMKTIATLAADRTAAEPGSTITIKWTVRVRNGLTSTLYSGTANGVRTLLATVPFPAKLSIRGSSTEDQATVALSQASILNAAKGTYSDQREKNAYECYTKLTQGEFLIKDDKGRYFYLDGSGNILASESESAPTPTAVTKEGVYRIYMNLNTMTYVMKEISKVEFWMVSPGNRAELTYEAGGVWVIENYAWNLKTGVNGDSRHKFICTFADSSVEYWGHFEDDCRDANKVEGEKNKLFYNIFRHSYTSDNWGNTWKVNEGEKEGFSMNVTFRLNMNNTAASIFLLERSYTGTPEYRMPSAVSIQGTSTESQASMKFSRASLLQTATSVTYSDQRESGAFECYTKLTAGNFVISDNYNQYYKLDGGNITVSTTSVSNSNTAEGIYRIYVNFNTMTYTMKKIAKVEFWLVNPGNKDELTYEGNGVWAIEDYEWNYKPGGTTDSRHKFVCTYDDSSVEYWGHYEDDCRHSEDATKPALFFNIFRHATSVGEWEHTWKVNQAAQEGYDMNATFRLNMNNTAASIFLLERRFYTPGLVIPDDLYISGTATEWGTLAGAKKMRKISAGIFEVYTSMTQGGTYVLTNGTGAEAVAYRGSNLTPIAIASAAINSPNTNSSAYQYRVKVDFTAQTITTQVIRSVYLYQCSQNSGVMLDYVGDGHWQKSGWTKASGDDRYLFRVSYTAGNPASNGDAWVESWCSKNKDNPSAPNSGTATSFWNIAVLNPVSYGKNQWDYSFKWLNGNQGAVSVNVDIYMNADTPNHVVAF